MTNVLFVTVNKYAHYMLEHILNKSPTLKAIVIHNKIYNIKCHRKTQKSIFIITANIPCKQADVDLSYLLKDSHILSQNVQYSCHVNTPSQMRHP